MSIATETEKTGIIVRTIGEGPEDGDEMKEILDILYAIHESWLEAKKCGKKVVVKIYIA